MKILFLNPPFKPYFSRTSRSPAVSKGRTLYYPFWLCYAAGVADEEGHDIRVIDAVADNISTEDLKKEMKNFQPEMMVIDTSTPSIYSDIKVLAELKETCPNAYSVIVGTHVSAIPEWTLDQSDKIDAVAMKEYDYIIRDLAQAIEKKEDIYKLKGLTFRLPDGSYKFNGAYDLIQDLDKVPFVTKVYKKFLEPKKYYFAAADYPMVMLITGRGCPFKCFYCVYPQTFHSRSYRLRSAENVVQEFEYVKANFPHVKEIGIEDDTFTANRKRTIEICQKLVERKVNLKFYANVRANLDLTTLKWLKKAGCRLVTVGFEAGNDKLLKNMAKGLRTSQSLDFMKFAKQAKLLVHGCIMVGNPGETRETMEESLQFAKKLDCDSFQFYPLYPYPGTEGYDWAKKNGYLLTEDYSKWIDEHGNHNCVVSTPELSNYDLVDFCNSAYKRYHLNKRYLAKKFGQLFTSPSEGIRSLRSGFNYFTSAKPGSENHTKSLN